MGLAGATGTHPHAQWRMFQGRKHTRSARIDYLKYLGPRSRRAAVTSCRACPHGRQLCARDTATLARHPSQQAAHHLPCGRPPDFFGPPAIPCRPRQQRVFGGRDRQERRQDLRAFVATRSGLDTMPSPAAGAQDAADITEDPPAIHGPEGLVEFRTKLLELQVITRSTPLDPTQLTFISPSYFQSTPYFQSTYSLSASAPGPAFRAAYVTSLRVSTR